MARWSRAATVPAMRIGRQTLVALAVLALAACDDSNNGAADTTTAPATTVTPDTTASTTTAEVATTAPTTTAESTTSAPATSVAPATTESVATTGDEGQLVESALLTLDDMPAGWMETPRDDDEEEDLETVQRISECSGLDAVLIGDEVLGDTEARTPEFESPDELASVKQSVGLAADEETAIAAIAEIGDPALAPCYEDVIRAEFEEGGTGTDPADTLPPGMTLTDVTMALREPPVDVPADEAVWYSAIASLDYQGQQIDIYLDLLFTRTGRVLSQLEFDGTTMPFPEDLYEPTVNAAQAKIDAIASA